MVRHKGLKEDGFWAPPGGGIDFNQTIVETLQREFLEETGLLVRPKNPHQLALEIERLIKDKKYAKSLGIKLHGHVVQNFSHAKMLAETGRVYGLIKPVSS